jgi:hypothetical protein
LRRDHGAHRRRRQSPQAARASPGDSAWSAVRSVRLSSSGSKTQPSRRRSACRKTPASL